MLRFFCVFGAFICDLSGFYIKVDKLYLIEQISVSVANIDTHGDRLFFFRFFLKQHQYHLRDNYTPSK